MDLDQLVSLLLNQRGLTTPKQIQEFFHPPHPDELSLSESGLDANSVDSAIQLIKQHISAGNKIAVYGDYDVDGLCSTAILWETLYDKSHSPHVFPHIPHRRSEGYGLSIAGIDHCLAKDTKLIIAVDNGIVAHDQIRHCRDQGCDIIIIDHHEPEEKLPDANAIIHSPKSCAAALTWFFSREYKSTLHPSLKLGEGGIPHSRKGEVPDHLSLVALAAVCDLVPLLGLNRSLVKFGLQAMRDTDRPGLLALIAEASIDQSRLEAYHLGFIIGPRLNAMGRLEHAIDSLRLLCTRSTTQAHQLASLLGQTNRSRQDLTLQSTEHAINFITQTYGKHLPKLLIVADPSYDEGIIGLIAAKLVEKFHRPAIALSVGEQFSKASARSVAGFHITDHLRTASHLLTGVGGHAMAAGFTVPTENLSELSQLLTTSASTSIADNLLIPQRRVDAEIPLSLVSFDLHDRLHEFSPFGLANPHPIFLTRNLSIENPRHLGKSLQHLKFMVESLEAIAFNYPSDPPSPADLYYQVNTNTFNGQTTLQLVVKGISEATHGSSSE